MDAQKALADLTEISSQIKAAVVFEGTGRIAGSTLPDGQAFAQAAAELLAAADELRPGDSPLKQLEVSVGDGSVFIVRQDEATIAATTGADPTVGLVFYDLKSALRSVAAAKPKPKAPARKRSTAAAAKKSSTPKKAPAKKAAPRKKKPDAS